MSWSKLRSQIPNALTIARVLLAGVFPILSPGLRIYAFLLAMLTEFLDGFLARHWKVTSDFGRILDPIADKLFALSAGITLLVSTDLEFYHLAGVLTRDIIVGLVSIVLILSGQMGLVKRFRPNRIGKLATLFQYLYFLSILAGLSPNSPLFWLTTLISVAAAVSYARDFKKLSGS